MPTPSIAELWDREIARKAERKAAKAKAPPAKSSSQPEATGLTPARVPPRLAAPAKRGRFVAPIAAPVPPRPAETTALVPSPSRPMAPARPRVIETVDPAHAHRARGSRGACRAETEGRGKDTARRRQGRAPGLGGRRSGRRRAKTLNSLWVRAEPRNKGRCCAICFIRRRIERSTPSR